MMGSGSSGGMMSMMGMCSMMHPAITVDANYIYVVRGDQVFKLSKKNLRVLSSVTLPPVPGMSSMGTMGGMPRSGMTGRGPVMMTRPEMAQKMQQMRQMQPAQFERSFLQNMIRHHQGAIEMSRLALSKATHPELHNFAQKTIDNQGREQNQFASWLSSWYKASAVREPTQTDVQMIVNLKGLNGQDFEIQFMEDMITHHNEAVQMGRDAQQKAVHSDVKTAASNIVNEQSSEIGQLRNWLSSWYGINVSGE